MERSRHPACMRARCDGAVAAAAALLVALAACSDAAARTDDASPPALREEEVPRPPLVVQGRAPAVTPDDYRRWLAAEHALAAIGVTDLAAHIPADDGVTEADVARFTAALERHAPIRAAIESAGLTVERYVRTSIALERALIPADPDLGAPRRERSEASLRISDRGRDQRSFASTASSFWSPPSPVYTTVPVRSSTTTYDVAGTS